MDKLKIKKVLLQWMDEKKIGSRATFQNMEGDSISKRLKNGEIKVTSLMRSMFLHSDVSEKFEEWIQEGRIMNTEKALINYNVTTLYALHQLCIEGELVRFNYMGKYAVFYIRNI